MSDPWREATAFLASQPAPELAWGWARDSLAALAPPSEAAERASAALLRSPGWQAAPAAAQARLWLATLCAVRGAGERPGGPPRARLARRELWSGGVGPAEREAVCGLVEHAGLPGQTPELGRLERRLRWAALAADPAELTLVAAAAAWGLPEVAREDALAAVALFEEAAAALEPLEFPDAWSRFRYFRDPSRAPGAEVYDDSRCEVTLTVGLPASGKSTWCEGALGGRGRVHLDALREQLGIAPEDEQGPVVAAARALAREHLRASRDFVWEATNLSRDVRRQVLELCEGYRARVRLACCEVSASELAARNGERPRPVPARALERMLQRWDHPHPAEAWRVERVV